VVYTFILFFEVCQSGCFQVWIEKEATGAIPTIHTTPELKKRIFKRRSPILNISSIPTARTCTLDDNNEHNNKHACACVGQTK